MSLFKTRASSIFTAACLSTLIAVFLTSLLLGANYLSAKLPRPIIHERIVKAFSNEDLVNAVHLRTNTKQGAHQYNDCLILAMAFDDRPAPALRALSPVTPPVMLDNNPCAYLKSISSGSEPVPLSPAAFYHRYLHGQVAVTALALQWLDLPTVRIVYDAFAFSILTLLVASNLILLRSTLVRIHDQASRAQYIQQASRHGFLLLLSCVLVLFYSVQFYGMSLGHGPSDAVVYLYLLTATYVNFSAWRSWQTLTIHAAFGVFTAYFELFTGGVPLGLSIIFLCYASLAVGPHRTEIWWLGCLSAGAFLCAFFVAVITKLLVAGSFFGYGEVFTNFLSQLQFWTEGNRVGIFDAAIALAQSAHYLGAGWRLLGVSLLGFSGFAFAYSLVVILKRLRSGGNWECPTLLVLSYASIILWYVVFRKHAYQHNFFMIRISVMLITSSLLLLALASRNQLVGLLRSLAALADAPTKLQRTS